MSEGQYLSDFVGYKVGKPVSIAPLVGFVGLLDFTGLPVGIPPYVPPTPVVVGSMGVGGRPRIAKVKRRNDDDDVIFLLK